jgi:CubicO group peptidase (beta-lactamase class C family)
VVSAAATVVGVILWLVREVGPRETEPASRLERIVLNEVAGKSSVKSCSLAVARSDGSLNWSGAAGIEDEAAQIVMTTPIYIASVTKLYTATRKCPGRC